VILGFGALVLLIGVAGSALIVAWGGRLGEAAVRGTLLGAALAAAGAIGGMALFVWSLPRGPGQFFGALAIGILARLAGFGAVLVFVALRAPSYGLVALAASLLAFYVVFQILEVRFVLKGLPVRRS